MHTLWSKISAVLKDTQLQLERGLPTDQIYISHHTLKHRRSASSDVLQKSSKLRSERGNPPWKLFLPGRAELCNLQTGFDPTTRWYKAKRATPVCHWNFGSRLPSNTSLHNSHARDYKYLLGILSKRGFKTVSLHARVGNVHNYSRWQDVRKKMWLIINIDALFRKLHTLPVSQTEHGEGARCNRGGNDINIHHSKINNYVSVHHEYEGEDELIYWLVSSWHIF